MSSNLIARSINMETQMTAKPPTVEAFVVLESMVLLPPEPAPDASSRQF
ncbi:hypothetical protein [Kordiimonas sediminis]|nr:hypothetical protein [Kordiimonas sediminis]